MKHFNQADGKRDYELITAESLPTNVFFVDERQLDNFVIGSYPPSTPTASSCSL